MPNLKEAPHTSDEVLLRRFASKRSDADFAELVRRYLPLVLTVTHRRLGNSGLAEDAAQQVFIALSAKAKHVAKLPSLAAWLQKAAVFEASNLARKESRHQRRIEQSADLWQENTASVNLQALDKALASLPQIDRQILVLHHFEKLTFAEIGARLQLSEAAAQRRAHRALSKLAKLIQSKDSDQAACSALITAAFLPGDVPQSPALLARISTLKKSAVLPWIPLVIVAAITGTAAVAVKTYRQEPIPPPSSASTAPIREQALSRSFKPQTADDDLSAVLREFIALAKTNSTEAWEFAKQQPQGAERFLGQAVRALADRDLPAANRLLGIIDGDQIRRVVISNIFDSRGHGNFESAIFWIDSLDDPVDRKAINDSYCDWYSTGHLDFDYDYAGSLTLARQPEVRNWLLEQACEKASGLDETQIEDLASALKGDERRLVLGHLTSLLLQRNNPRAYELLDQVRPDDTHSFDLLPNIKEIALRNPQRLLDWMSTQSDGKNRYYMASALWRQWGQADAQAAATWWLDLSEKQRNQLGLRSTTDPTLKRLISQP